MPEVVRERLMLSGVGVPVREGLVESDEDRVIAAMGARSWLSLCTVLKGNLVLQVLHTGTGLQKTVMM